MSSPSKPVGVAVSGAQLVALLADRELTELLDETALAFAIAGIDRIDGSAPDGPTVESTIATATLAGRARRIGWLAAAAVHRDHPYNLARRIASIDHLSDGRAGLLLGLRDGYAAAGPDGHEVWGGSGLGDGFPIAIETATDAAVAIQELWQSWPYESIVADRGSGVYSRSERIVQIDHQGVFEIAGPLTVPTTPQGSPVLAWRPGTIAEAAAARRDGDLLLWPVDEAHGVDEVGSLAGEAALFVELAADGPAFERRLAQALADDRVGGVVLRTDPTPRALRELATVTVPWLLAAGAIQPPRGGTLRTRLRLLPARARLDGARSAFPAPTPNP